MPPLHTSISSLVACQATPKRLWGASPGLVETLSARNLIKSLKVGRLSAETGWVRKQHSARTIRARYGRPRALVALCACAIFLLGLSACQTTGRSTKTQSENRSGQTASEGAPHCDIPLRGSNNTYIEGPPFNFTVAPSPNEVVTVTGTLKDSTPLVNGPGARQLKANIAEATIKKRSTNEVIGTVGSGAKFSTFVPYLDFDANQYPSFSLDGRLGASQPERINALWGRLHEAPNTTVPNNVDQPDVVIQNVTSQAVTVSDIYRAFDCTRALSGAVYSPRTGGTESWPVEESIEPSPTGPNGWRLWIPEAKLPQADYRGNSFGQVQICGTSCLYAMWGMSSAGRTQQCVSAPVRPEPEPSTQAALICKVDETSSPVTFIVTESKCAAPLGWGHIEGRHRSVNVRVYNCTPVDVWIQVRDWSGDLNDNPNGKKISPGGYVTFSTGSGGDTHGWGRLCTDSQCPQAHGENSPAIMANFHWENDFGTSNKAECGVAPTFQYGSASPTYWCRGDVDNTGDLDNIAGFVLCSPTNDKPNLVCPKAFP